MNQRPRRLLILAGALALAAAPIAASAQTESEPAPPAESDATAADAGGAVTLSDTRAEADEESSSGEASSVEVGGDPPSEQFGGEANAEQHGDEEQASGATVDTGENEDGRARVTPWEAEASSSEQQRDARGEAWLADLNLGGAEGINVEVLHSRSEAHHFGQTSQSNAETEALDVKLGGDQLHIELLHAESSSKGEGNAYLLSINENEIGNAEQFDRGCDIEIPGVLHLICVTAEGGEGSALAKVAEATLGPNEEEGFRALLFGTGTVGGEAVAEAADGFAPAPEVLGEVAEPPPEQARAVDDGVLPVTGGSLQWTLLGLVLASLGAAGRWAVPRLATVKARKG